MVQIGIYCRTCFRFLGFGADAGPCGGIEWVEKCGGCVERDVGLQVRRAYEESMWTRRECADEDCVVVFRPRRAGQRFCCDQHRKRTHHRLKTARLTRL